MSDKPNVTVVYSTPSNDTGMGCMELVVSLAVLAFVAVAVTGLGLWDLAMWVLFGG